MHESFSVHRPQEAPLKGDQQPLLPVDRLVAPHSEGTAAVPLLSSSEGVDCRVTAAGVLSVPLVFKRLHKHNESGQDVRGNPLAARVRGTTCRSISLRLMSILAMKRSQNPAGTKLIFMSRWRVLLVCWRKPWMSTAGLYGRR